MLSKGFPKYSSQRKTGDRGVTLVKSIVEDQLVWIFRPSHLEDDFGLDGYIDIIGIDHSVTGKYFGVQIKTGESYFKIENSFGWKYIGENKHLNYFLNSSFPILLILVNLDLQKAYWVEFDINKTEKTNKGWSIIIPKENLLDKNSNQKLKKLTGDVIDYMSQIEYQWEVTKRLKKSDLILLNVSKEEILEKDVSGFVDLVERLTINDEMIKKARGKITFLIDGYNLDEREIFEIPEIREWTKLVIPAFKYWGYFLNMDESIANFAGLKFLQFSYVDIEIIKRDKKRKLIDVSADAQESLQLMKLLFEWLNEFTEKYRISREINNEQTDLIMGILFGDIIKK